MSEMIKCIDFCGVCGKDIIYIIPKTMEWKGRKYAEYVRKQLRAQGGDLVDGKRYCAGCVTEMHITRAVRAIEDIHYSRIWMLEEELEQVRRERDAAVRDVKSLCATNYFSGNYCAYCKYNEPDGQCHHDCTPYSADWGWQWRGVQENKRRINND
jgi:hypothetical protein